MTVAVDHHGELLMVLALAHRELDRRNYGRQSAAPTPTTRSTT